MLPSMQHSASRAVALLRALNLRPVSAVAELARDTGISKPSVVRLLAILIEDGYVERASRPGSYMLTRKVLELAAGFGEDSTLVRIARPWMEQVTREIGWPTALGIFEAGAMVVRHSTIPTSPLAWYRTTLHMRLSLLGSAMGQAYLANCPEAVRRQLLAACDGDSPAPAEITEEFFARVRKRGYGLRPAGAADPTFSISVPILVGVTPAGCLSATLYARSMAVAEAVRRYHERLLHVAAAIAAELAASAAVAR